MISGVLLAAMLIAGGVIAYEAVSDAVPTSSGSLPPPDTSPYGATGALPGALVTPLPGTPAGQASSQDGLPPTTGLVGIPATVLAAYHSAQTQLAAQAPGCHLSWSLVAGIGKIESDHARGGQVDTSGTTATPILGPVLDGSGGNAAIPDTDGGRLDHDPTWDRAVGPTQFLPATWATWGADGNGDGHADPNNVFDAATATGRYLCAGDTDTSTAAGAHEAVFRYNHSEAYVAHVLAWAHAYATGTIPTLDAGTAPSAPADAGSSDEPSSTATGTVATSPPSSAPPVLAAPTPPAGAPGPAAPTTAPTPPAGAAGPLIPIAAAPAPPATQGPTAAATPPGLVATPTAPAPLPSTPGRATAAPPTASTPVGPTTPPRATATGPASSRPPRATAATTLPRPQAPDSTTATPEATTTTSPASSTAPPSTATSSTATPSTATPDAAATAPAPAAVIPSPVASSSSATSTSDTATTTSDTGTGAVLDTDRSGIAALLGSVQTDGAPRPQIVTTTAGSPGLQFTMPGGGRRSEVLPPLPAYREGQQVWLHYRAQLAGVPVQTSSWQLIAQFHQQANTGSPPVALEVGDGQLRLASQGSHQQSLGPVSADGTVDVTLHVVFSRDPAKGLVDIWRDGTPVLAGYHPPGGTLLDGGDYLKLGLYRDPAITEPSAVTITSVQAGPTAAAIGPSSSLQR